METYEEFIQNILTTRGRFQCGDQYHERHHIKPKCLSGTDDKENLIDLFPREHFIAHKLLAEENPEEYSLVYAWWMMSHIQGKDQEMLQITPEEYEKARIAFINVQKERFSIPENNPMYGRRGENSPFYGKCRPQEVVESLRKAAKERWQNPEYRDKMVKMQKERLATPENNPMFGKCPSAETRKKIGDANRGHVPSEDAKNKASESMKKRWQEPIYREQQSERMKEVCSRPEYKQKQRESHCGAKSHNALAVINIDTNKVYGAAILASSDSGIDNSWILKCCKGKAKTAGGYNWKYIYDYTDKNDVVIPGAITLGIITEEEVLKQLNKQQND